MFVCIGAKAAGMPAGVTAANPSGRGEAASDFVKRWSGIWDRPVRPSFEKALLKVSMLRLSRERVLMLL